MRDQRIRQLEEALDWEAAKVGQLQADNRRLCEQIAAVRALADDIHVPKRVQRRIRIALGGAA